jgi:hypothetical protein
MSRIRLAMVSLLMSTALLSVQAQSDFQVTVTVTDNHVTPNKPVAGVRVWLTFQDGTEHVTDDQQRTNKAGQARLWLSPAAMEQHLRVEITEAPGLMIYTPADGVLGDKVPATLQVSLLPKGSPAFLKPAQIEAMMNRLWSAMRKNQELMKELTQAKEEVTQAKNEKSDFDLALEEWASDHGLVYAELDQKLREWAQDIETHQEGKSLTLLAEAALGLRNYEEAGRLYHQSGEASLRAFKRDEEQEERATKKKRQDLFDYVQSLAKSAWAFQSKSLYTQASVVAEEARTQVDAIYRRNSTDAAIRHSWALANLVALYIEWAQARWALSHQSHVAESARQLADVIAKSKEMLTQIRQQDEPEYHAFMSIVVIVGSMYLGEVSDSKRAADLRNEAVEYAKAVVDSWDKAKDPGTWAHFEEIYAVTLAAKAGRGFTDAQWSVAQAVQGINDAVDAFSSTLDIYKTAGDLRDWAEAKTRIADLLSLEGQNPTIPREARNEVLSRAEAAYQDALSQTDKSKDPVGWSTLQAAIGEVDGTRAMIGDPSHSAEQWARAVSALTDALQARPKEEDLEHWANVEHSLALVLENEGEATPGAAGAGFLEESARDYVEECKVFSKDGFPQRWARAQADRASVLHQEAGRLEPAKSAPIYAEAAAGYQAALAVFTREAYPQRWAAAQIGIGQALAAQADHLEPTQSIDLYVQAAAADKAALEVFTKQGYPQGWAEANLQMATSLGAEGTRMQGAAAKPVLKESVAAFLDLLELYPKDPGLLSRVIGIEHDYLGEFDQAYVMTKRLEEAQPSDGNKLNLAEAAMTDGKFAECMDVVKGTDESKLEGEYALVRRALMLSCAWGAGDRAGARAAAGSLVEAAPAAKHGWNTNGDRGYLSGAKEFAVGRERWIGLYQAIQDGDAKAIADSAQALTKLTVQ